MLDQETIRTDIPEEEQELLSMEQEFYSSALEEWHRTGVLPILSGVLGILVAIALSILEGS